MIHGDFLDHIRTVIVRLKSGMYNPWLPGEYQKVFDSESGRLVLQDLCLKFHVMRGTDGSELLEGERRAVLYILQQLRANPADLQQMADRQIKDEGAQE